MIKMYNKINKTDDLIILSNEIAYLLNIRLKG